MSKKNRPKKPTLSPEAWSWLAQNVGDDWSRILDLRLISTDAVLAFVKSRMAPESFADFEELSLPAEVVAARRKARALKKEAEEIEKRTIFLDGRHPELTHGQLVEGRPLWRTLDRVQQDEREAEIRAQYEREHYTLVETPEATF